MPTTGAAAYLHRLSARKVELATAHLGEAGLLDHVESRHGDALETLADVDAPIGVVLLDGWKDLYLPVLHLLEPKLPPGAMVVGDDSTFPALADYLAYVRDPGNGYVTTNFPWKTAWRSAAAPECGSGLRAIG